MSINECDIIALTTINVKPAELQKTTFLIAIMPYPAVVIVHIRLYNLGRIRHYYRKI